MNYIFDVDVAREFGVDEAVVINNFQFWILKNRADGVNSNEGRTWTFNTIKSLAIVFPFWSEKQIRRIIESLVSKGILMTGNFNKAAYDRTIWYAFSDESKWLEPLLNPILPNGQMQSPKRANSIAQMGGPIPDNKTKIINTDKKERKKERKKDCARSVPDFINLDAWNEFEQHRKDIKKPLTDLARRKLFSKLKNLSPGQQAEVMDHSITCGYTGLFVDRVLQKNEVGYAKNVGFSKKESASERNARISRETREQFEKTIADEVAAGIV